MMDSSHYAYATAALIVALVASQAMRKAFDPFAPVWLFLAGYAQVYVVQALSYREWALQARGEELVAAANCRALWALAWFLAVYYSGLGRLIARRMPAAPVRWSIPLAGSMIPVLFVWGLASSGLAIVFGDDSRELSAEEALFYQYPVMMALSGILLIVNGRHASPPKSLLVWAGLGVNALYSAIWMFNGKRSHPLIALLMTIAAFYITRGKRPGKPVLAVTAVAAVLAVTLALGWRNNTNYQRSFSGFVDYLGDFKPEKILVNVNLGAEEVADSSNRYLYSKESEEIGGFYLMMATVPDLAEYDYGANYIRLVSTYIPRVIWPSKPIYGRDKWTAAWIAGSEFERKEDFTGPSIGILGATQLNGGAAGTAVVLAVVALVLRTGYEYFRLYSGSPWAQAWWSVTYFVAWLMTVNDDPAVWFYYIYGHTILPPIALLWAYNKFFARTP